MSEQQIFRIDSVKIPKVKKTKEGYLRGDVVASRSGVFRYLNADGSERFELRHPDDVFKKDSLESLKMIPVTRNHPDELVNSTNSHKYQKGFTGENYDVADGKIIVSLTVTDSSLIEEIEKGDKQELSLGYTVQLVKEDGEYNGQKYQYRQINPVYNHLAAVDVARAGKEARFRFDAQTASSGVVSDTNDKSLLTKGKFMSDEDLKLKLDAAEAGVKQKNAELELSKAQLSQTQLKVDALEKALKGVQEHLEREQKKTEPKAVNQRVLDRFEIFARASSVLDVPAYIQHSDREVMIAALNAKSKETYDYADYDDSYIKGRFDSMFVGTLQRVAEKNVFKTLSQQVNSDNSVDINNRLATAFKESWSKAKNGEK